MRKKFIYLMIISVFMLRCATTEIGSVIDRQLKATTYKSVLFVSTLSNLLQKEQIEETFFEASSNLNINRYISMRILPPVRDYSTAEIEEILDTYKIDGVLFIALQEYWETNVYIPGQSQVKGSVTLIGNVLNFSARKVDSPGIMMAKPNAIFECRFFDPRIDNFVWKSTSKTSGTMFADFSIVARSLSQTTIERLVQDSIFQKKREPNSFQGASTQSTITESQAINTIRNAEDLFTTGKLNEAIIKLGNLDQLISNSDEITEKGKLLARMTFLRGLYFFEKNSVEPALANWHAAVKFDPGFTPPQVYGLGIIKKYQDFIESSNSEEINKKERQKQELNKISKSDNIRIIKEGAALRLEPSNESLVIRLLPLGGVLKVDDVIGDWIKIVLPADRDGIPIVGYLHVSFIIKMNREEV